jgi:hypothetical protein
MDCDATIDGKYRYRLTRTWQPKLAPLVWIMLNPSTADASRDDPTIRRCIGFAMNAGFGGIEVYNLFALRATCPAELLRWTPDPVGDKNDSYLFSIDKTRTIICGWGSGLRELQTMIQNRRGQLGKLLRDQPLFCLGWTASGQPLHPLRVPYAQEFLAFLL